ncbi:heavy-metal-associated domain-containing protein [Amnibacterium endophyticum]|uniref:Heavy-metal-associated domain-containing protein n=1 Tax=Amnibacterium endophyticum TaxID=2109337 RepID=A0ABW4LHP2_9MICO
MQHDLGLTDISRPASSGGCCGGGACACGGHAGAASEPSSSTGAQTYAVTGMTCGHCVASVTEELEALPGVESVDVRLQPGGASTVSVRSARALGDDEVRAAVEEAGYALA